MSKESMDTLRYMLCDELDEIAQKQELSAGDLETVHKLTDTIKNIDKIYIMEEDGEYSQAGDWEMGARGNYDRGNSYRGRHYVRGHYSRDGGRDGRMVYSRTDGRERMMGHLEQMMQEAGTEKERAAIRRCMEQLGNA